MPTLAKLAIVGRVMIYRAKLESDWPGDF
jgi:hypothetical protein